MVYSGSGGAAAAALLSPDAAASGPCPPVPLPDSSSSPPRTADPQPALTPSLPGLPAPVSRPEGAQLPKMAAGTAAGASEWLVMRDGCRRCDEQGVSSLSYHPALNAILAVTSRGSIKVIDGTSGAILQASAVHAKPGGRVRCQYFPTVDKVIFVDDYSVGCRKDLNGILLLDTALQTPVSKPEDVVQLELPVTEAQQLLSACLEKIDVCSAEGYDLFIMQLKDGFKNTSHETAANHKVAKWATVTLHLPHHVLKSVTSAIVNELKKINQNIAALPVASSIMDRLSYLLPSARPELGVGPGRSVDRSLMYSEANRRETFTSWPHVGYRWAQPDPMAQAGFYHQPASSGDDRAMCFTCSVCLVCWEPTDEPWSEHERHSPNCPFVKGEHTQNVPLSVTLATCPAQFPATDGTDRISCFGVGNCPHLLAAATKRGKICVWDVSKLMKVHLKFEVNAYDPAVVQLLVIAGDSGAAVEARRPTLAWLEDSSSCSDIPKLEGDSDDLLDDSDSEERSRSDSVTGHPSQKESLEMSLDITALSILQQPEKLQWEIVANVLEDTVKDLEELGANPSLVGCKSEKTKEKHSEQHNIPFPCLLTGGLLTYKSPTSSPTSSNCRRSLDALNRTPGESSSEQGSTDNESGTNSDLNSTLVKRTMPVLLIYSIKESDEKAGKLFSQMNNLMSKSLHDDGFTVPQIIEMELDNQEQLLLQDPPVTYIQQFAEATASLASPDSDKWTAMVPKPGTLVQCMKLPKFAEEENLCVDSIIPCADGVHLLVGLQKCPADSLSAINQVEALNNLNKLNSALCSRRKGEAESSLAAVNGTSINVIPCESSTSVHDPLIIPPDQRRVSGGYLVIYKINYTTRIVTLEEEPVKILHIKDPQDAVTSLILLQPDVLDNRDDDCEEPTEEAHLIPKNVNGKEKKSDLLSLGHLVVTTQGGFVKILDLSTFEVMAKVDPPKREGTEEVDPFVSVVYCSGTDRLCACTKGGELHFLQIGGACDDLDETDILVDGSLTKSVEQFVEGIKPMSNPSSPGLTGVDLLVEQDFSLEILTCLVELTRFETFIPRFSATVPPCWVEVQQEQQQRRHPQHLHQQHHGDAAQHTRTWKLQNDSNSWDEHVFELVLPKACMVGHVDFKFLLNSNITNIPQIQVTLLKNKAPGLAKVNETPIDRHISFPLSPAFNVETQRNGKPAFVDLSEEMQNMEVEDSQCPRLCPFLEDHKEDILCGPVWLASGLDLSGHAGMLTLTSPKLVKGMAGGKYRSFLIHVKAVNDRGSEELCNGGTRPVLRIPSLKPQSAKGHSLASLLAKVVPGKDKTASKIDTSNSSRKIDNLRGCDFLQEVSVTIRRFKKTCIPKERVQRCAMLQFSEFHEKLLNTLCKKTDDGLATEHAQSLALDILCWLAGVHSNGPGSLREGKESLLSKTRKCLSDIVRACFFEAGRSIAHKCSRFLALCISNGKCDPSQQGFGYVLLKALLENITYLPSAATGGSVYWYFVLLNYVKDEDLAGCSTACASLLTAVSRQLQDRLTPMEALLQTRYGLYSSPFDPVLFDLEVSGSSCKNIYNSSSGIQSDEIDLSDVLLGSGKVNSCAAAEGSFTSLTGLLEVEPLHFTCVSTSDGTRIERDDASTFTVSTFGVTPAVGGLSAGTVGEASTALSSAAQVALQSLSHAMASAEQQLQVLQEKQQQLLKLQQQKAKLEAKLHQTTVAAAAAAASAGGPVHNSVPSNPVSTPGFFIHPSDVIPPTPKTTPLFMTPPLTPPNESVSAVINAELAQLFPGTVIDSPPAILAAHSKNANKSRAVNNQLGSGLALAISHASHFLQPPPHQSIIIERMHSGARRFVTLDFGRPVLLTDILIPTCGDLASLSIDIWSLGEEVDGRRLVVATDISTHSLILHDLIPPPVCRFMKITVIGRYGSTNARAKIPLGFYYGHTYILPWESELKLMHDPLRGETESASQPEIDQHLTMMVALQEDIQCRYNLACHRLETLLQSIDLPPLNSANNAQYFLRKPDKAVEEDSRVFSAYQDCIQLQLQLNLAHHAVQRLKVALGMSRKTMHEQFDSRELIYTSSTEQLRTVIRYLLDTLLSLLHSSNGHSVPVVLQNTFHAQACEELFKHLCISGTPKIRLHTGLLLVQLCGAERWWGQFLSNVLQELYNSEQLLIFPQDRVFVLLSCIGQRSLGNSGVLESLLNLLDNLLSPLQPYLSVYRRVEGVLDIPMISWVVMLVSRLLDYVATVEDEAAASKKPLSGKERERFFSGNQWSFINNSLHTHSLSRSSKGSSSLDRLYSRKIRKQLVHHKQQLNLLKAKQKALVEQIEKEKIQSNKGSSYKLLVEQAKLKQATSKHFKDLIRLRRTAEWPRSAQDTEISATKESPEIEPLPFTLAHERCISVVQKLALFLLSMDFTCHADLLLFVCKVLARIANATRPTIHLCEVVNEQQLERLLLLLVGTDFNRGDISWGGAWAQYSLTCMLQDILAGELLAPIAAEALDDGAMGEEAGASAADSDDVLQQSSVLPLVETVDEPLTPDISGAPPLSALDKDKEIDLELLQDLMEVDIDPLDIDLEKDPLAAKVFKPISSTWYDYWGADYGTYNYNPYIGGVGIPVAKPPASTEKNGTQTVTVSVSQALDARLEVGLEQQAELMLKMMSTLEADSILQALTNSSPTLSQTSSGTDDSLLRGLHAASQSNQLIVQLSSIPMLSACFNKLFSMLQVHHVQLESLLQLWLTLSLNSSLCGGKENGGDLFLYNANRVPVISINQASITSFLTVLAWHPNTLLRTWCLVLHSLTLMTNMQLNSGPISNIGAQENTAQLLVSDPNLLNVLVKFLSGTNLHGTNQHSPQVGPTATQAMQEFLTRLQVHLSSTSPQMFSEFLLKLIHILSTERGAFQTGQGPLDAQVKLLEFTLEQNFEVVSVSTISAVIESVTFLVHHYITCSDKVVSRSGSDSSVGARACFGGLFANIIRPGDAKAVCGEMTRDQLMFDLLKLVNILVQLPLSSNKEFSARAPVVTSTTDSVSDEEKVYGGKDSNSNSSSTQSSTAYVADLVLANQQIMSQILSALGQCNSSAMAMIIGASGLHLTKHENFHGGLDAISVGDGLFTILTTLSKKASTVQVMLQPILTYMACGYMGRQIQLVKAEVASAVCLRLHRPRDASTLGLSQIKLLGLTAFGNTSSATVNNPFLPSEDQVSKTSIGWLRLLHHCLTHISELEAMMASAAAPTANLLQTCAALLMSPYCGMHSPNIEAVLVKIGLQSTRIGLRLIDILLRNCAASGSDPGDLNSPLLFGRLNGLSSDSTIDILYQLGTTQDPGTKDRIQALLKWVSDSARVASLKRSARNSYISPNRSPREFGLLMPSPSHLHCVAAILWHSYELPVDYDLPGLLSRDLFESLYKWSMSLPCNMVLKKAVDGLLCSMCHIHPSYFSLLMGWMGITPPPIQSHHRLSITDDSKKQDLNASLTDDSKNAQATLALTESHLATLAASSQSPEAIKQLLDSGLPSLLVRSLVNFCFNPISNSDCAATSTDCTQDRLRRQHTSQHFTRMPVTADLVAPILRFLTEVGNSHVMKDWLGGSEVNPLWTALLYLLCHSCASSAGHVSGTQQASARGTVLPTAAGNGLTTQQRTAVENATVAFFLQCISCHPNNQRLMAQVLCELFQSSPQRGNLPALGNISGFIRRLFLQLMLEDEKVTMFLQSPCPLYKGRINATSHVIQHPMYGAGHKFRTLHLPISTTLAELLDRVSDTPSITAKLINEQKDDKEKKNHEEKEKVKAENGFQDNYSVVVASGLKSQSKRAVASTPPRPPSRRGRVMTDKVGSSSGVDSSSKTISIPVFHLYHKLLPGQPLPPEMTLAQLLTLLYDRKLPQGFRSVDLTVKLGSKVISDPSLSKTDSFKRLHTEKEHGDFLGSCPEDEVISPSDECMESVLDDSFMDTCPIQSPLQVFAGMGGLALIAERLPMLYPDVIQQVSAPVVTSTTQEKPKDSDQFEWVTIEQSGELVYEAPETIAAEPPPIKSAVQTMSPIPAHSLAAFGLFLRLPGYAEVLLKERKHAQCLLRLVLGVTDDGEGSHILQSPSANVLPTLPFHVLRTLFSTMPLTTDDGVLLRRMALEIGAIHLILACLSALSHHAPRIPSSSSNQTEVSSTHSSGTCEEQQLYWAKGTGFGTGSTASGWDVEQALTKQRLEEEHVTCLLLVLASYINPSGCAVNGETQTNEGRGHNSNALPSVLQELLSQSCLIPAMSSYLRNDSVLDMARHVPLYRALLELLRAIASCVALVPLLLPLYGSNGEEEEEQSESQVSVGTLLAKMKTCVDTYTNRLRSKKDKAKAGVKPDASDPEPEGLTLLVPDIQRTAEIVFVATTSLRQANQEKKLAEFSKKSAVKSKPFSVLRSLEEKYVAIMKKLQFDTFEMVSEDDDGKLVFKVNYHYMSQVKNASDANSAARARRLAQEAVTLSTSLPLSSSSSVFVRCDEERLDIMKVLITGPADTPYANGCFEFDVYFPQDYPNSPPLVNLETTGGHSVRFNPNLYNDGKVCLSILNTWHGRPEEKWNPQTSSFLQVLVSVQSLILVSEPYFNEPGYERSRGTPSGTQSSREYDGNIRQATVKWAMLEQIRNASPCFKEVIHKHFYLKRAEIMAQCEDWIVDIQQFSSDKRVGRTMSHHAAALKRHTAQLREELLKLQCPEGLDPDADDSTEKCLATASCEETTLHDQVNPSSSKDTPSDFTF
ncbi:baculoviral IAP repeat-containing 6 isoform X1 [Pelobates cultripes]|uniref:Dual E2 ubiquitin-conjugating enzyme/E3 ubiquitin-protein ligase BIRC6 n=1 Tax=Pelobates cultripes TaxID=61616 RepID=A0AAD1RE70_PELCU|nr:baculoviral IAP repeat-containing 6 isoform X1 [Pelobates cultripes]